MKIELSWGNVFTDEIEKVLEGDDDALMSAFFWVISPQGHDFWEQEYTDGLSVDGQAALREMLAQAKELAK